VRESQWQSQIKSLAKCKLLVSSLTQTDELAKLLIEKGLITPRRFYEEDFRGTSDVSEAIESHGP